MRLFVLFILCSLYLFSFDYHLKPYKLGDGIHCFFGIPSNISYQNGGNMINSCYIETEEGYIVVDSGPTYQYANSTYALMQTFKKMPVKYVINTSSDEVHILGNSFFKEKGAILIAPQSYKKSLMTKKSLSLRTKLSEDVFSKTNLISADLYLKYKYTINLGKTKFYIKAITNDSEHLVVYVPKKKILFSGDMIFNNRLPIFENNRSIIIWRKALKKLKKLPWKDTVSSHGLMTRRSAFLYTEKYLNLLEEEVTKALKKKKSKNEAIKNIKLSMFKNDKLYKKWHHQNVALVYDELFKNKDILIKKRTKNISDRALKKGKIKTISKVKKIHYVNFSKALKEAKRKKKIILMKIRSTHCKYCDQLDKVLGKNKKVRKLIDKYFEIVKINLDKEKIPLSVMVRSTPTLLFLKPNKELLMQLTGIRALGEVLEVLNEAVVDGHNGGYLYQ